MSLVADYTSSGSESDSSEESEKDHPSICTGVKSKNFLSSQDASSTSSDDSDSPQSQRAPSAKAALPLPEVFSSSEVAENNGSNSNLLSLSVFSNPFENARQEKLSILEKHVKLKEQDKQGPGMGRSKNVCYKFLKGHCRFGNTCKFSHAAGDQQAEMKCATPHQTPPGPSVGRGVGAAHQGAGYWEQGQEDEEVVEEETMMKKRKDRAGLSAALIPSKKAMRIYDRQRAKERPWTEKR